MQTARTISGPGLGLVPDWYFSSDPKQNPHINSHIGPPMPTTGHPVGIVMVDHNPLGYVFRDENPLQGMFDTAGWVYTHKKQIGIGVGIVGAALALTWLMYQVGT